MKQFKELADRLMALAGQRDAWQRHADNATGFISEAGVKHAKAHLAVVKRDYDATSREIVCLLS